MLSLPASALTFKSGEPLSSNAPAPAIEIENGPSFLIPQDVWLSYEKAPKDVRGEICGRPSLNPTALSLLPREIPKRLKGLNSRMDNWRNAEGFAELDELVRKLPQFVTLAHANGAEEQLVSALRALERLAEEQGWVDTKSCTKNGYYSECKPAWRQKDGQDLAESMDFSAAQVRIMHLFYMYKAFLSADYGQEFRRDEIDDWFAVFIQRNKRVKDVYFGLDLGWHWPEFAKLHETNTSKAKQLAENMMRQLDDLVLDDGSLKDRTTRGNRALWYHYEAIGETLISIEIARGLGVEIDPVLEEKLLKSAEIFIKGFEDPSSLNKWASKAHNSIYRPDEQKFNNSLDSLRWANSWFYIFQYRYPQHPVSEQLRRLLGASKKSLAVDGMVGIGLGCVYEVARQMRQG